MTTFYTANRNYPKPDFDSAAWHVQMNQALDMIDLDTAAFFTSPNLVVEAWTTSTAYVINDKVLDIPRSQLFMCNVNHSSGSDFLADRTAHPTYWSAFGVPLVPRGAWTNSVIYNVLDHVYDAVQGIVAICSLAHTSVPTGNIKSAGEIGNWLFVVDNSTLITSINNSVTAAANSASAAANSASAASASATNAANSASAASASATNAQAYATNASASATSATNSASSASSSASSALASKNAAAVSETNAAASAAAAASSASSALAAAVQVSDTPPAAPTQGKMWFDSASSQLYVRYDDGTSAQWVVAVNNPPDLSSYATISYVDQGATAARGGYRNLLRRNGGFEIWQRGAGGAAAFAVPASAIQYTADGWYLVTSAGQICSVSQSSALGIAQVAGSQWCAAIQRNAGQAGTTIQTFGFPLDVDEFTPAIGHFVRLSFTAWCGANFSPSGGNITAIFGYGGSAPAKYVSGGFTGAVNIISQAVPLTGTPTRFQINSSVAMLNTARQAEVLFQWTPVGTAGANDYWVIDDVQLEIVPAATGYVSSDFERLNFEEQLLLCQRHYYKSFFYHIAPAAGAGLGNGEWYFAQAMGASISQRLPMMLRYPVPMRVSPTVATLNPVTASDINIRNDNTSTDWTVTSVARGGQHGCMLASTSAVGSAIGHEGSIHVTADAGI